MLLDLLRRPDDLERGIFESRSGRGDRSLTSGGKEMVRETRRGDTLAVFAGGICAGGRTDDGEGKRRAQLLIYKSLCGVESEQQGRIA